MVPPLRRTRRRRRPNATAPLTVYPGRQSCLRPEPELRGRRDPRQPGHHPSRHRRNSGCNPRRHRRARLLHAPALTDRSRRAPSCTTAASGPAVVTLGAAAALLGSRRALRVRTFPTSLAVLTPASPTAPPVAQQAQRCQLAAWTCRAARCSHPEQARCLACPRPTGGARAQQGHHQRRRRDVGQHRRGDQAAPGAKPRGDHPGHRAVCRTTSRRSPTRTGGGGAGMCERPWGGRPCPVPPFRRRTAP
jgi:hypothetical protein